MLNFNFVAKSFVWTCFLFILNIIKVIQKTIIIYNEKIINYSWKKFKNRKFFWWNEMSFHQSVWSMKYDNETDTDTGIDTDMNRLFKEKREQRKSFQFKLLVWWFFWSLILKESGLKASSCTPNIVILNI